MLSIVHVHLAIAIENHTSLTFLHAKTNYHRPRLHKYDRDVWTFFCKKPTLVVLQHTISTASEQNHTYPAWSCLLDLALSGCLDGSYSCKLKRPKRFLEFKNWYSPTSDQGRKLYNVQDWFIVIMILTFLLDSALVSRSRCHPKLITLHSHDFFPSCACNWRTGRIPKWSFVGFRLENAKDQVTRHCCIIYGTTVETG